MPAEETLLGHSGIGSRPRVIGDDRKRPLIARVIGLFGLVPRRPAWDFLRTVGQGSPPVRRLLLAIAIVPAFGVAALADFQESQVALGLGNYAVAIPGIVMSARNGDPRAKYVLSGFYRSGLFGLPKDISKANILDKEAVDEFMRNAEKGDAVAKYWLGEAYLQGTNELGKDIDLGVNLIHESAIQGPAYAQFRVSELYSEGKHVGKDIAEAIGWLKKATEQGYPSAQVRLAMRYNYGHGLIKDDAMAVRLLRMAVEQDNPSAHWELGKLYCEGRGVPRIPVEAIRRYHLAARISPVYAWFLAMDYEIDLSGDSECVGYNLDQSARLFLKAAEMSWGVWGTEDLGGMYAEARGLAHDDVRAHMWLSIAIDRVGGGERVVKKLVDVEKRMTPSQVVRAKDLAREWLDNHSVIR